MISRRRTRRGRGGEGARAHNRAVGHLRTHAAGISCLRRRTGTAQAGDLRLYHETLRGPASEPGAGEQHRTLHAPAGIRIRVLPYLEQPL